MTTTPNSPVLTQSPKKDEKVRDRTVEREKARLRKQKERDTRKAEKMAEASRLKRERGDSDVEVILQPSEDEMAPKKVKTEKKVKPEKKRKFEAIEHDLTEDGCLACEEEYTLTGATSHFQENSPTAGSSSPFAADSALSVPSPWVPLAIGLGGVFAYQKSPVIRTFVDSGWAMLQSAHSAATTATTAKEQLCLALSKNGVEQRDGQGSCLAPPPAVCVSTLPPA